MVQYGFPREVNIEGEPVSQDCEADEQLVRHILNNAISNALKYSTLDQPVYITINSDQGGIRIVIKDLGIGIPQADQAKIFSMFHRASNVGTISGTGLGLVILKRCIDLLNGTVPLKSEPGKGTEFTLWLPMKATQTLTLNELLMRKTRFLVIEDEPRMRDNILTILRMEGYEVCEASNGQEGVEQSRQLLPDLILCDVSMPVLDGYGTLSALRETPDTAQIPFIFLTARGDKQDVRSGMNNGADDYLVKPFETTELLASIESRLKRKSELKTTKPAREPKPKLLIPLGLTEREAETLFWLARGKANSDQETQLIPKISRRVKLFIFSQRLCTAPLSPRRNSFR